MLPSSARAPGAAPGCFHCGLPLPTGLSFGFEATDGWRAFCCAGCEAVSRSISGLGLDDYYRLRAVPAARPDITVDDLGVFDDALVQSRFVRVAPGGGADACLLIEGMRCPACAWLLEHALAREPGVAAFEVNFTTRRARLSWDPAVVELSRVLAAVRALGYTAWPHEPGRLALVEGRERSALLRRLWVAGLAMMQVMMYAVPAYIAGEGEMTADVVQLMRWAGLVLTAPVLAYSAAPFLAGAWRDLSRGRAGMDVPIALALVAATGASLVATLRGQGDVYFDSITMFVFLLLGARYLEVVARARAGDALAHLARLAPQTAHRFAGPGNAPTEEVAVARLAVGDRVLVRPGETVPADGILESAEAHVSEAWLSGESRPIARACGERVVGGAVNAGSAFAVRVEHVGAATALSAIQQMMERALAERPRWVEVAQRASEFFVVAILVAAAASGVAWLFIDAARAPWVAVAVLVVTCPCALALAAPLAATAACGALARANLVVSRAGAVEALAGASDVVFDKTGTLTYGRPRLLQTVPLGPHDGAHALSLAAALARWSAHPVDRALAQAAGIGDGPVVEEHRSVPGAGIEGRVAGVRLRLGRAAFVQEIHGRPPPLTWIRTSDTSVFLGSEHGWIAGFRLGDEIRPEAREAVARLRKLGLRVHLLSGDERGVAEAVATALAIDHVVAPASPQGKLAYVRDLQQAGARVVMVGDGINDAPVLACADVSVAMGGGADLAQVRADAVLLSDSLDDFVRACLIARKARRVTRQNLGWALAYNLVALPIAIAGLLTPLVAAVGMSASSLAVVANVLRLRIRELHFGAIPLRQLIVVNSNSPRRN